jgi:hypothetical protein
MRRSFLLISLLLAAAAISVLAMAGPAGARTLAPRALCPAIQQCCPDPVAGPVDCCPVSSSCCGPTVCCGTTTCCPAGTSGTCCSPTACTSGSLTIASSSDPSTAGRKVVISGALTASPASGAQVILWRETAGQSSFRQLASTTTDSSGGYSFTLKRGTVLADQALYVTSGSLRSSTLEQEVRAIVGLAASTRAITSGQAIVLRGNVTPSHAGQALLIEQRRGGTWHVIARPRLSKGSTYSLSHRFVHTGKSQLRAVLPAGARNLASTSPTVTVTVKS